MVSLTEYSVEHTLIFKNDSKEAYCKLEVYREVELYMLYLFQIQGNV